MYQKQYVVHLKHLKCDMEELDYHGGCNICHVLLLETNI